MLVPLLLDLGVAGTAPPVIVVQPTPAGVSLGQQATFQVFATGNNLSYQWFVQSAPYTAVPQPIPGATGSSYTTDPATQSMNGNLYYVVVSNSAGTATSNTVGLSVVVPIIAQVAPTPGTTSGTISHTVFNTDKLISSAFRRCRLSSGQFGGELADLAKQQLYLYLSELANAAVPLWCIDKQIMPLVLGSNTVTCPIGTIDVMNLMLRTLQFQTGTIVSSDGGNASALQNMTTTGSFSQTVQNGSITVTLPSAVPLTQFGFLPAADGSWTYTINVSSDGSTFTPIISQTLQVIADGQWQWYDVDSFLSQADANVLQNVIAYQISASGGTTLALSQFLAGNTPTEITMGILNRDDYANLPNKSFPGQPVQYWLDKQFYQPVLHIWPAPDIQSQFRQLVMTRHRHIMDVGTLPQIIEVPQRWLNAIIDKLAAAIAIETPEVEELAIKRGEPPGITDRLIARGNESEAKAWSRESDHSPMRLAPDISCYTQ